MRRLLGRTLQRPAKHRFAVEAHRQRAERRRPLERHGLGGVVEVDAFEVDASALDDDDVTMTT